MKINEKKNKYSNEHRKRVNDRETEKKKNTKYAMIENSNNNDINKPSIIRIKKI